MLNALSAPFHPSSPTTNPAKVNITQQPMDCMVLQGGVAQLYCEAECEPHGPLYQWFISQVGEGGRSAPFLSKERQRSNSCYSMQTLFTMADTAVVALTPIWPRKKKDEWHSQSLSGLRSLWLVSREDASYTHVLWGHW